MRKVQADFYSRLSEEVEMCQCKRGRINPLLSSLHKFFYNLEALLQTQTQRHIDTKIQRHKDKVMKTQRHIDTKTHKSKDTKT